MKSSGTITNSDPMSRSHLKPGQKVGLLTLNRIVGVKTKERRRTIKIKMNQIEAQGQGDDLGLG